MSSHGSHGEHHAGQTKSGHRRPDFGLSHPSKSARASDRGPPHSAVTAPRSARMLARGSIRRVRQRALSVPVDHCRAVNGLRRLSYPRNESLASEQLRAGVGFWFQTVAGKLLGEQDVRTRNVSQCAGSLADCTPGEPTTPSGSQRIAGGAKSAAKRRSQSVVRVNAHVASLTMTSRRHRWRATFPGCYDRDATNMAVRSSHPYSIFHVT
jgi:hypothetical protein